MLWDFHKVVVMVFSASHKASNYIMVNCGGCSLPLLLPPPFSLLSSLLLATIHCGILINRDDARDSHFSFNYYLSKKKKSQHWVKNPEDAKRRIHDQVCVQTLHHFISKFIPLPYLVIMYISRNLN